MKRMLVKKAFLFSLLISLMIIISTGSVLAEESGPPLDPGLVSQEGIVLQRPAGPGYSVDTRQTAESLVGTDTNPELMSWTKLLSESFDGTFPSTGWDFYSDPGGAYIWGPDSSRSYSPNMSAYPAVSGTGAFDPRDQEYENNMIAWMTYGPMDLSTAAEARLTFQMMMETEPYSDVLHVCASDDDLTYHCNNWSGGTMAGWNYLEYSFSDWPGVGDLMGSPEVWIAFIFQSNATNTEQGVFIDDVIVYSTSSAAEPDLYAYHYDPTPNLFHPGDTLDTYSQFVNAGLADCANYDVTEYLSTDAVVTSGDIEIGSASYAGPIQPTEIWYAVGAPLIPESVTPGLYYLGVMYSCAGDTETSNDVIVYNNQIEVTAVGVGGRIFQDNFESRGYTAWTRFNDGRTGLSVCSEAAMNGSFGACFYRPPGNDKRRQLIDETPVDQTTFNVRFSFDINGLSMLEGERFRFMQVKWGAERPFFIVMKYESGQYLIQLNTLQDDLTKVKTSWYVLTDDVHVIEVDWQASSSMGANDGLIELYLDDVMLEDIGGLDNDTLYVESFKVGYTSRMEGKSISGTFYVDDVTTSSGGYIGLP